MMDKSNKTQQVDVKSTKYRMQDSPYNTKTRSFYEPNKMQIDKIAKNLEELCKEKDIDDSVLESFRDIQLEESKTVVIKPRHATSYLDKLLAEQHQQQQETLSSY